MAAVFDLSRLESVPADKRGFGLRQIAEASENNGGLVHIQSQPGQGMRLTVEVPLRSSKLRREISTSRQQT